MSSIRGGHDALQSRSVNAARPIRSMPVCSANMLLVCLGFAWQPPSPVALHLRALTRAIADLGVIHTQQNNRAYAAAASQALPVLVVKEMQRHKKYLEQRMTRLRREAVRLIACDPELDRRFRLMLTTIGIAETSALQILGELAALPDMLDARQWVAFSGLDPRLFKSGKSVEKRPRISRSGSRHLRRALYMPALVALRRDPYLRVFYQNLLARGKARLQAVVAVMRKLLHALFAMFRSNQPYDGSKLCAVDLARPCRLAACCLSDPKKREGSPHLS